MHPTNYEKSLAESPSMHDSKGLNETNIVESLADSIG